MRVIKFLILLVVAVTILVMAVANMEIVSVNIDPFGFGLDSLRPLEVPLAFIVFAAAFLGLLIGVVMMRLVSTPIYRERNKQQREIKTLRAELEKLHETLKDADHPASIAALPAPKR